eukprot:scaffold1500_cov398-Prasinococcus_capsulatus_cf.AAC.16
MSVELVDAGESGCDSLISSSPPDIPKTSSLHIIAEYMATPTPKTNVSIHKGSCSSISTTSNMHMRVSDT